MATQTARFQRPIRDEIRQLMYRYLGINGTIVEPEFSRNHAWAVPEGCCWICHFPLGGRGDAKELYGHLDHVIPSVIERATMEEGAFKMGQRNTTRPAHRYCNSSRHDRPVTQQFVIKVRSYMIERHWEWLVTKDIDLRLVPPYMDKILKGANPRVKGAQPWLAIPRAVAEHSPWFDRIEEAQQYVADHPEYITMHSPEDDASVELDEFLPQSAWPPSGKGSPAEYSAQHKPRKLKLERPLTAEEKKEREEMDELDDLL